MKKWLGVWIFCCFAPMAAPALWVTGYFPAYENSLPPGKIDFTTVTHVIHFALGPESNGSIDSADNGLNASACQALVNAAHAKGRKALICVGGAGSETAFQAATKPANLTTFVNNLVNFMNTYGYDGIDIDWEPYVSGDTAQYTNFVKAVRTSLGTFSQHKLLTVAAPAYPSYGDSPTAEFAMFASIQTNFDQINVMTYDLSGPYEGWVTWFNSPISDGGYTFPNTSELVPSVNGAMSNFTGNGVSEELLGVGLPFYGYIWTGGPGVSQPRQSWPNTNPPSVTTPTYVEIMKNYYQSNRYHWDGIAQSPYLSITNTPSTSDIFLSYDDATECQVKVSYARNHHLGGLMIWELTQDYFSGETNSQPLLQTLNQAMTTPKITSVQFAGTNLTFSFSTLPLANYRVLWTSNLTTGVWNTLTNNITGTGGTVGVSDSTIGDAQRFYQVQTPP